jgi:hypothetical protein
MNQSYWQPPESIYDVYEAGTIKLRPAKIWLDLSSSDQLRPPKSALNGIPAGRVFVLSGRRPRRGAIIIAMRHLTFQGQGDGWRYNLA